MQILTDGTHLIDSRTNVLDSRPSSDLYGPVAIDLAAGRGAQWWGHASRGDELSFQVSVSSDALLQLEVLDQDFRRIGRGVRRGRSWVVEVQVERDGVVYLRAHNADEEDVAAYMSLVVEPRPVSSRPSSMRSASILEWFRRRVRGAFPAHA